MEVANFETEQKVTRVTYNTAVNCVTERVSGMDVSLQRESKVTTTASTARELKVPLSFSQCLIEMNSWLA